MARQKLAPGSRRAPNLIHKDAAAVSEGEDGRLGAGGAGRKKEVKGKGNEMN